MPADNWRICPRCLLGRELELEKKSAQLEEAYGVASPRAYADLLREVEELEALIYNKELDRTLREDFEIGMEEDGNFYIHYRASCITCGFSFKHKKEKQVDIVGEEK